MFDGLVAKMKPADAKLMLVLAGHFKHRSDWCEAHPDYDRLAAHVTRLARALLKLEKVARLVSAHYQTNNLVPDEAPRAVLGADFMVLDQAINESDKALASLAGKGVK